MPPCSVVQAGCAAVASRDAAKPVIISDSYQLHLEDASSICVNPVMELIKAATEKIGREKCVSALVSIGGHFLGALDSKDAQKYKAMEASAKAVHSQLRQGLSNSTIYSRFELPYKALIGSQDDSLRNSVLDYIDEDAVDKLVHKLITSSLLGKTRQSLSELCEYCKHSRFILTRFLVPLCQQTPQSTAKEVRESKINIPPVADQPVLMAAARKDGNNSTSPVDRSVYAEFTASINKEKMELGRLQENSSKDHEQVVASLKKISKLCWVIGRYQDAVEYGEKVTFKLGGWSTDGETPLYLDAVSTLALYKAGKGDHKAARDLAEHTVKTQKRHRFLGLNHPQTLRGTLVLLATYYNFSQHDTIVAMAEGLINTCRSIRSGQLSDNLRKTYKMIEFSGLGMKARCLWALGKHEDAVKHGVEANSLCKELYPEKSADGYLAGSNLMLYLTFDEDYEEASVQEQRIMKDCVQLLGRHHPVAIDSRANLALRYSHLGRADEALRLGEEVFKLREGLFGPEHPDTLLARSYLAMYLANTGKYQQALSIEEKVLDDFQKTQGSEHPHTAATIHNMARYYYELGRYSEALEYGRQALYSRERIIGKNHPYTKLTRKRVKDYQAKVSTPHI
jgi:tetratricopeptide (TPR) repeat protein